MRLDAHQHFWRYSPARDQWITAEMSVLQRDFLPEELLGELQANGMDGSIAVQADQSEAETDFLLDLARQYAPIRGVVGWVDFRAANVAERLRSYSRSKKLCGFRHIVQGEPDDRFMLGDDFLRGIGCLREFGFTYDILIYSPQLPAAIELVARYPEQRFVLDHLAKPPIRAKQSLPWAQHMRQIASHPNVYLKVSGLVTEADWRGWRAEDFRPYLDVAFEAFGVDRLMFGSDWPVCLLAGTYGEVLQLIEDYTRNLAASDREKIFGLNAARFYGI